MSHLRFSRRMLLRGTGGAILGLPWLASLPSHAQDAAPKRLILVYNPNGTLPAEFWPSTLSGTTDFQLGTMLAPLAPHQAEISLLKGLALSVGETGPGGPHQKGIGGLFTGRELLTGNFSDGCGSLAGFASGISLDQEVARLLGAKTRYRSLEFGVRCTRADVQSRISYAGSNQPLPPMTSPQESFQRIFHEGISPHKPSTANLAGKRSILDAVLGQLSTLRTRMSAEDQYVLDKHTTLVRDIERRIGITSESCAQPATPPDLADESEGTMEEIGQLQVDLLATAFACDLTRVASLQFSDGYNRIRMPWVGSMGEGHSLSHTGPSDTSARTQLIARGQWYAAMVARLLDHLKRTPEANGTMLDNTLVIWGNEVGEGSSHTHQNLPFVVAGSAGGALKTGLFLDYGGRPHNDLLLTALLAMGISADSFGNPNYVTGPLLDLLA